MFANAQNMHRLVLSLFHWKFLRSNKSIKNKSKRAQEHHLKQSTNFLEQKAKQNTKENDTHTRQK